MAIPFRVIGIIAFIIGLIWIGQGAGYFAYPRSSFMISQIQWAYYGAVLCVVGVAMLAFARGR